MFPSTPDPERKARALFCISGKLRCHMDNFSAKFRRPAGRPDIRWRQRIEFVERKRLDLFQLQIGFVLTDDLLLLAGCSGAIKLGVRLERGGLAHRLTILRPHLVKRN